MKNNSYDTRIVNYENMQGLTNADFDMMVMALDPQNGDTILDVGAGYGAATREIMKRNKDKEINYVILEKSEIQVERAKREISKICSSDYINKYVRFINSSLQEYHFLHSSFHKIIAKAFIHEIPEHEKEYCFRSIYEMLKTEGKFVVWNIVLDEKNKDFYRKVIRQKDKIGGFTSLVNDRHFLTEKELKDALLAVGFNSVTEYYSFMYKNQSSTRLSEFKNDKNKLIEYNEFIKKTAYSMTSLDQEYIKLKVEGINVSFSMKQGIYIATKA